MPDFQYKNFDLVITRSDAGYRTRIGDEQDPPAESYFQLPFSASEIETFALRVTQARRLRRLDSPQVQAAKDFGGRLFNVVFAPAVRTIFERRLSEATKSHEWGGLRIRLDLTAVPELANVPWEYLFHPTRDFLALDIKTPLVRFLKLPGTARPLEILPPLRVLVVISDPEDSDVRLNVGREWEGLVQAVGDMQKRGLVTLDLLGGTSGRATLSNLRSRLRDKEYHVFHFVGHGRFDRRNQGGDLAFEDEDKGTEPVSDQDLGIVLRKHPSLRLAVLNACEGARSSPDDPFAGVAHSLVRQGIPAVIAMQFEILDEAAITFSREFYDALVKSYPVDAAVTEARIAVHTDVHDIEWGTPVLYLRAPNGRIFDVSETVSKSPDVEVRSTPESMLGLLQGVVVGHKVLTILLLLAVVLVSPYIVNYLSPNVAGISLATLNPGGNPTGRLTPTSQSVFAQLPTTGPPSGAASPTVSVAASIPTSSTTPQASGGLSVSYGQVTTPSSRAGTSDLAAVQISAGYLHTCALMTTGGVKCWGANDHGQLGNGSSPSSSTPVDVAGLTSGVVSVSAGGDHTCAVMTGGRIKCWGKDDHGQLGNGRTEYSSTPLDVSDLGIGVKEVVTGNDHTCALTSSDGVKCWGNGMHGQLGNGSLDDSSKPVDVTGLTVGVQTISASGDHTCAVTAGGDVECWGNNQGDLLGKDDPADIRAPVKVAGLSGAVKLVSTGGDHTCVLTAAGGVKCWGTNNQGELGNGGATNMSTPVDVSGLSRGVTAISAGGSSTCALTAGGIKCWGSNFAGQLGNGGAPSLMPVNVTGLSSGVAAISVGGNLHACAVLTNGGVKCWGSNSNGQLGNGNSGDQNTPVDVVGLSDAQADIRGRESGFVNGSNGGIS